jgi:hypothetical protein
MIHGGTDGYVTDPARATGPVSIRFAMALVLLPLQRLCFNLQKPEVIQLPCPVFQRNAATSTSFE